MKNTMFITRNLVWLVTLTMLVCGACYAKTAGEFDKVLDVSGLKENVVVRRDARSIPYIEAKNQSDLYFAQGFETARDRLWQMDLFRRVARGRLAELFGKAVLNEDKRWRRFGFSGIADESLKVMDSGLRKALGDYARGVNAYIATLDKKNLPVEFQILQYEPEPWKPTDTIVIGKILADGLSATWWKDLNRLGLQKLSKAKYEALINITTPSDLVLYGEDTKKARGAKSRSKRFAVEFTLGLREFIADARQTRKNSLERIGFYAKRLAASNNWVISGKHTADGKAILANDPHLPASAPGIWYLAHLSTPTMRVSGVTIPGVPGVVLGHNESIAWGATNVGPDVQDVYFEEFNAKGEYKTPNGWKKPKIRKELIKFRPNPISPKMESETLEVVETRNGVVIQERKGKKIALKWTARNPVNQEFEVFFLLNSAKNWKGFKNALKTYGGASQNFVYADTKGNIGWHVGGKIPIRRKGEGAFPYEGATSDGDWVGYIPFAELPHLYNPKNGFIVTANQRIVGTDYKYQQITRQIAGPWRARRLYDLITSKSKITMDDVGKMQHDSFNIPLTMFVAEIIKRNAATPETLAKLKSWNGRMTADSVTATIANQISRCVGGTIARENKPASQWQIRQSILHWAIANNDKLWLPKRFSTWAAFIKSCEIEGIKQLSKMKRMGTNPSDWRWGKFRSASFRHPLATVPFIGGQFKASFTNVDGSGQSPNIGANVSMRFIAKPANWDKTRHVVPLGQSGNPKSPHWKDQFESWRTGKSEVFPFSKYAVRKATKNTILLKSN